MLVREDLSKEEGWGRDSRRGRIGLSKEEGGGGARSKTDSLFCAYVPRLNRNISTCSVCGTVYLFSQILTN